MLTDQPLNPIVLSINTAATDVIIICSNTWPAIFVFLFIQYITVIHIYTIPQHANADHGISGIVNPFISINIDANIIEVIKKIFNNISPSLFFIF